MTYPGVSFMNDSSSTRGARGFWIAAGLLILFGLLVFRGVLGGGLLVTTDDGIGALAMRQRTMPGGFLGCWNDLSLLGVMEPLNIGWTNLLLFLMPLKAFTNWIHFLDLAAGAIFLAQFLRMRGLSVASALMGAITTFWLGSTFFLIHAGHLGKFGVLPYIGFALWQIERAVQKKSILSGLLAGGALGGAFLEQQDLALFFALVIGPYAAWRFVFPFGGLAPARSPAPWLRLAALGLVCALMGLPPILAGWREFGAKAHAGAESKEAKWDYATQWSWPPDETIEWVAPGYMGWRSGEPQGPYWGRLGRSPGWEQTRQGFMNFKLETFYMGSIPVVLTLLGACIAFSRRWAGEWRGDLIFWTAAAVITFLLGLGKFFPLYKAFFALPGMSSIRNPVKFMQVTQLAMGILAAHGMDSLLRRDPKTGAAPVPAWFRWVALGFGCLLLLAAFSALSGQAGAVQRLSTMGWGPQYAPVIVSNQVAGLLRAAGLALLAWAFIHFAPRLSIALAGRVAAALVAIVMIDQLTVSPHYVQSVRDETLIGKNAVTEALQTTATGGQRAYVVAQEGFYNNWMTYLFAYHGICTFNVSQMRMPDDYQRYLTTLQRQPDRLWRLSGVGHLLGPSQMLPQLDALPGLRGKLKPSLAFDVLAGSDGSINVTMPQPGQSGAHVIASIVAPAPRYALLAGWTTAADDAALAALANPAVPLFEQLHVAPDSATGLATSSGAGLTGDVEVVSYRPGRVVLKTNADVPTILRAAERFTPDWKATLDGKPIDVLRVDFMLQGVALPAGEHTVELVFRPPTGTLKLQFAGMGLCLLALLGIPLEQRFRRNA